MRVRVIPCPVRIVVPALSRVPVDQPLVALNVAKVNAVSWLRRAVKGGALARLPHSPTGDPSASFAVRLPAVGKDSASMKADMQALVVADPTWNLAVDHPGMAGAQAR